MKLPPMNALRAFEAVSRHGSVSKAADELCVSQGAVSQQLRNLEDYFGRELFHRGANAFTLTDEGEVFGVEVQQSLQRIAAAAGNFAGVKSQHKLKISATPTLIYKWLMPKLGDFYEIHPGIAVVLEESLKLVTFKNDGFDAAIRFGDGEFDNLNSDVLLPFKIHAVASPAYIEKHGRLESTSRPQGHHLIDYYADSKNINSQHVHWRDLVEGDLAEIDHQHLVYPDGLQLITAAVHGMGIALLPMYMCEDEIKEGSLELLSEQVYEYSNRYYFVSPTDARPSKALDVFRDWLLDISKQHRDDDAAG